MTDSFSSIAAMIAVTALLASAPRPVFAAAPVEPTTPAEDAPEGPTDALDDVLESAARAGELQGVFLVIDDGEIVYERGLGTDGSVGDLPITPDTRFEIASLAKPLTAIGIMTLVESGAIGLDDPAADHVPGFPYADITVRHLLSHTSGLPGHEAFLTEHWEAGGRATPRALIAALREADIEPSAAPGARVGYSNLNYWTLALMIEEVSGRRYAAFMHNRVFVPLGMHRTSVRCAPLRPETAPPGLAVGEVRGDDGSWTRAGDTPGTAFVDFLSATEGDVHITSTARDVARLAAVTRGASILGPASVEAMITPVTLADGSMATGGGWKPYAAGLGWKLSRPAEVWHDGNWGGFVSYASFEPRSGDGLIYLLRRPPSDYRLVNRVFGAAEAVQNATDGD